MNPVTTQLVFVTQDGSWSVLDRVYVHEALRCGHRSDSGVRDRHFAYLITMLGEIVYGTRTYNPVTRVEPER